VDLEVILPETLKKDLEGFVSKELAKVLKGNVEATFSKKIAGGFTIGPKDGSYFISFTDETFNALISEYLRPATKKLLFG
jgi:V/A-type H+-transporting ATPase subunit E